MFGALIGPSLPRRLPLKPVGVGLCLWLASLGADLVAGCRAGQDGMQKRGTAGRSGSGDFGESPAGKPPGGVYAGNAGGDQVGAAGPAGAERLSGKLL